jgi:non-specific serine/threonine protein kinase
VTVTGAGGSGKTRLALELAGRLLPAFRDGVAFVELAPLSEPALVPSVVAQALELHERPTEPLEQTLADFLADKSLLLCLDNCEHLLTGMPFLSRLLGAAPELRLLATSRESLRLSGEQEYPLEPLPEEEAVAFFCARAQAANPRFSPDPAVGEICRRLDGLPLALELAATRVKLLSPEALLARLERRLPLLSRGTRDAPERQRTLEATIDWSYQLLTPAEQTLYSRLSVFAGGCTLEAAEVVCAVEGLDAFDGVASLVDKSLLRRREGMHAEPRFWMLETIREHALGRLDVDDEAEGVRRRHAVHFLALAERAELRGPRQATWFERLELEHDNLRAAIEWALLVDPELALELVASLGIFWALGGHLRQGETFMKSALEATSGGESVLRARVLRSVAWSVRARGDLGAARKTAEEGLRIARSLGDATATAVCLHTLGVIATDEGEFANARGLFDEALELFRAGGDKNLDRARGGRRGRSRATRRRLGSRRRGLRRFAAPCAGDRRRDGSRVQPAEPRGRRLPPG